MVNKEKYVVVPDLHGHDELIKATHNRYGDNVGYVILGDVIDGTNRVKETMNIITDIDSVLLSGNHEWVMLASIYERDRAKREVWQDQIWRPNGGGYHAGTLESYGVSTKGQARTRASRLGNMLFRAGHLEMLENAPLYYEDERVVAVHAGVTNTSWPVQKQQLDSALSRKQRHYFDDEPEQLFSHDLAKSDAGRACLIERVLITGHSSLVLSEEQRVSANGKRVRLGSRVRSGAPLYVWENWSRQVKAIAAE